MKPTINLDEWSLSEESLESLNHLVQVSIHIRYPGYEPFVDLVPQERRRAINAHYRQAYWRLIPLLSAFNFQRLGNHRRPIGIRLQTQLNQLAKLLPVLAQNADVSSVSIDAVEGLEPKEPAEEASFWSIQARFAIQIENVTGGLQKYEDRIILVKAFTEAEAQQKLLNGFESYAKPYLNSSGLLVRWKFEAFTDGYQLDASSPEDFLHEQGVEVFSTLGNRRIRPGQEWKTTD
ncbi:DUF4288 domain-containing protein [Hymenobacter sp. GOD-10R]|uniref:DUF4288 domain-containing protein n=1 Tax=Hymenobacter sp. GOD-10R TaxID=3093922 RepID=UPI002D79FB5B|nr:DUF4288 domain-containing protein [Hymenobacter sp. GOD-10R]WRQ26726.1 DUF4288 domain-containing protein [Hymenobacter sp. GOD-10R]